MHAGPVFKLTLSKVGGLKISKIDMKNMSHTYDVILKCLFKALQNKKFQHNSKIIKFDEINII